MDCIVLDFDHTVFNTTKLVAAWKDRFAADFEIDAETFMKHREKIKECNQVIDITHFVESFENKDPVALQASLHDVIKDCAGDWTHDDVLPFIHRHQDNYNILIATHGDQELQTEKITHSGLPSHIESIISTKDKATVLSDLLDQYETLYFIDDKPKNISLVKDVHGDAVITYFIARPEDKPYSDQAFTCDCADYQITSLAEVSLT